MKITEDEIYLTPTLERIQSKISRNKSSTKQLPSDLLINGLAASHLGLDPSQNLRHAPMVYHKNYSFDNWPTSHTFPMDKFRMTAYSLLNDLDESIGNEQPLVQSPTDFYNPLPFHEFPTSLLSPPIDKTFLHSFLSGKLTSEECRLIGFREQTSRPEVIERTVLEVAGTILTAQLALKYGLASHLAGGTHHAESRRGKGFTIINDLACAAYLMTWRETDCSDNLPWMRELYRRENAVERVLVVDCDVHQGDGTATFHNTESCGLNGKLFTLDLHAASNYPHPKEKCTYDVSIPDGCNDEQYMELLTESLEKALLEVEPQLVLYNAGVDPFEHDKLGRLSLT
jgi:acetoin utilization deacetylase AcuC-like enzyme